MNHSTVLAWVLFAVSFITSVYAVEIRRAIAAPPSRVYGWWKSRRLRFYESRLDFLTSLHDDPEILLPWLITQLGRAGLLAVVLLLFSTAIGVPTGIVKYPRVHASLFIIVRSFVAGSMFAIFQRLLTTGMSLTDYARSKRHLEQKIAHLKGEGT